MWIKEKKQYGQYGVLVPDKEEETPPPPPSVMVESTRTKANRAIIKCDKGCACLDFHRHT